MKRTVVAMGMIFISTTAEAQNVAGLGAVLCREVLPAMDNKSFQSQLFAWVTGYLTGINMTNEANGVGYRDLTTLNMSVVLGEVRAGCGRNPSAPVIMTVEPMYQNYPSVSP